MIIMHFPIVPSSAQYSKFANQNLMNAQQKKHWIYVFFIFPPPPPATNTALALAFKQQVPYDLPSAPPSTPPSTLHLQLQQYQVMFEELLPHLLSAFCLQHS
ncbi:unnamed protein product [Heterosigma akashiwo]